MIPPPVPPGDEPKNPLGLSGITPFAQFLKMLSGASAPKIASISIFSSDGKLVSLTKGPVSLTNFPQLKYFWPMPKGKPAQYWEYLAAVHKAHTERVTRIASKFPVCSAQNQLACEIAAGFGLFADQCAAQAKIEASGSAPQEIEE